MEEQIELKVFTIADLKQFFLHNRPVELLSERVINHTRAYATVMNPFVTDDMAIVSAIFVNNDVAAYTYVFPDQCLVNGKQRTIYWNTVLYVDPSYEGRGYGAIVIGQMVEQYGDDYFDLDAVPASVENLKFAGLQVDYVDQYVLDQKHINTQSLKGKLLDIYEKYRIARRKRQIGHVVSQCAYTLRYVSYIDDATYSFIQQHSQNDIFLRSQVMLNWILIYPLGQESPLLNRVQRQCAFSSTQEIFRFYAVQVYIEGQLVGVYIVRRKRDELYLNYLYYSLEYENIVFRSIVEHISNIQPIRFFTAHKVLADYVGGLHIFAHNRVYKKSFSHPVSFIYDKTKFIQAGDGDNIT